MQIIENNNMGKRFSSSSFQNTHTHSLHSSFPYAFRLASMNNEFIAIWRGAYYEQYCIHPSYERKATTVNNITYRDKVLVSSDNQ